MDIKSINNLTNRELRYLCRKCEDIIDDIKDIKDGDEILNHYNNLRGIVDTSLNLTKLMYVYKRISEEIEYRFSEYDLIDRDIILKYLDKELENISNPKKEKSIPYEARVGSILTIRTIKQFIINSH